MSWSHIPRWKFTDSCGRPRVPGAIHVGCAQDGHMQYGHATRRALLKAGVAIAGAAAAFPAPAISQGIRELKLATSWPKSEPGLSSSAARIGQAITAGTGKRIQVSVFTAGELVKPLEVFDAVSSGVVDMYHSAEYYWERRSPAFDFFAAVPFGFTADELAAWIH
jgi:TRAP-type mannitol/chloroaromatic compound transport system substrate-binding protein